MAQVMRQIGSWWRIVGWVVLGVTLLAAMIAGGADRRTVQTAVELHQPPDKLWRAITDHGRLPHHVAILRKVKVLERKEGGVGTIRECTLSNGRCFTEAITVWEEGRRYCYAPNPSQAPFPFKRAEACWSIELSGDGARLTYRLDYVPKSRWRDLVFYPFLRTYGVWQIRKMLKSYGALEPVGT